MRRFIVGVIAGFGVASVLFPKIFKKIIEENRLISDNGHIERHNKTTALLTKTKLSNDDYRDRYPENASSIR